LELLTLLS